jgi:hypothetical protein
MKNTILIFVTVLLSGCASYNDLTQDMIKSEIEYCKNKKLVTGTTEFQKCRQKYAVAYYNDKLDELQALEKIRRNLDQEDEIIDMSLTTKSLHSKKVLP